jgi:hypothetical protein
MGDITIFLRYFHNSPGSPTMANTLVKPGLSKSRLIQNSSEKPEGEDVIWNFMLMFALLGRGRFT